MQGDNLSIHNAAAGDDGVALAVEAINKARHAKNLIMGEELALDLAKRHSDDAVVQLKAFNLLHRMGRWEAMLSLFERAVNDGKIDTSPSTRALVAEAQLRLGKYDAAKAVLDKLDKRRVSGVAAKRLPVIEALSERLAKAQPAEKLKPQQNEASIERLRAIAHRTAPLNLSSEAVENLLANAGDALEHARVLRLERRTKAAAQLLELIIQRHPEDLDVVTASLNALHRNGSFHELIAILAKPENKVVASKAEIAILKADCLIKAGGAASREEAKELIVGIKSGEVSGVARKIWQRLRADLLKRSEDLDVRAIEDAFLEGNALKGATLFRALLDECRQFVASTPLADKPVEAAGDGAGEDTDGTGFAETARDVERARYSADFEAATGATAKPRRVLIVSDSIALPRPSTGVGLVESYPYRLHQIISSLDGDLSVEPDCRRGRTVLEALEVIESRNSWFEAIIVQVGIVDCAPRVFGPSDVRAVRALRGEAAAQSMVDIAKANRSALVGDRHNSVYVKAGQFAEKLSEFVKRAHAISDKVIVAGIVTPSKRGAKLLGVPLALNISDYNEIMRSTSSKLGAVFADCDNYIWSLDNPFECFTQDNYHYNAKGHRHCADFLSDIVSRNIEVSPSSTDQGRRI